MMISNANDVFQMCHGFVFGASWLYRLRTDVQ
jgi:hypothetical protein